MKYIYYSVVFFFFGFLISSILLFCKIVEKDREEKREMNHKQEISLKISEIKDQKNTIVSKR